MTHPRIFRVFLSSTFSDFHEERQALQDRVWPHLSEEAQKLGATFEAVDLRWGISRSAQQDHATLELCLEEIRRCQRLSPAPNFVALIGDRYGWEPILPKIPASIWDRIWISATSDERQILASSFRLDSNHLPDGEWILLPRGEWSSTLDEALILKILRDAVSRAALADHEAAPFFMSATHHEIDLGIFKDPNVHKHATVYFRTHSLPTSMPSPFESEDSQLSARQRLEALKLTLKSSDKVAISREYSVEWDIEESRQAYLDELVRDVLSDQLSQMRRRSQEVEAVSLSTSQRESSPWPIVLGLDNTLDSLEAGISHGIGSPIHGSLQLVSGPPGGGKTTVLRQVQARAANSWPNASIVVIGGGQSFPDQPDHYSGTAHRGSPTLIPERDLNMSVPNRQDSSVLDLLQRATPSTPVIVLIDDCHSQSSLDPHDLIELPPNTAVVLAISEGTPTQDLRAIFPEAQIVKTPLLSDSDLDELVTTRLAENGRQITEHQRLAMHTGSTTRFNPLWAVLATQVCMRLHSYDSAPLLPEGITNLANRILIDLETDKNHGAIFVRRALGMLAASRWGLSDSEMAIAISRDKAIRTDFDKRAEHPWVHDHLPQILWSRLRADLSFLLQENFRDGLLLLNFRFSPLKDMAQRRYVSAAANDDLEIHACLAKVFEPPKTSDNWLHVLPNGPKDPRVLRSLHEQRHHFARATLGQISDTEDLSASQVLMQPALKGGIRTWNEDRRLLTLAISESDSLSWPLNIQFEELLARALMSNLLDGLRDDPDETLSIMRILVAFQGYPDVQSALTSWSHTPTASPAAFGLGLVSLSSNMSQEDPPEIPREWLTAAIGGDRLCAHVAGELAIFVDDAESADYLLGIAWDLGSRAALLARGFMNMNIGQLEKATQDWGAAADAGDPDALVMRARGAFVAGNMDQAITEALKAAASHHVDALRLLVEINSDIGEFATARIWARQALAFGFSEMQLWILALESLEEGITNLSSTDLIRYLGVLEDAALVGSAQAMQELSLWYSEVGSSHLADAWLIRLRALGDRVDVVGSPAWNRLTARTSVAGGDAHAAYLKALALSNLGMGEEATEFMQLAAEWGESRAMLALADESDSTDGGSLGTDWIGLAAGRGDFEALERQAQIAAAANDWERAEQLWMLAAKSGSALAFLALAYLSEMRGDSVAERNNLEASADLGNIDAMLNLGGLAENASDLEGALSWFRLAHDAGSPEGTFRIGRLLNLEGKEDGWPFIEQAASLDIPDAIINLGLRAAAIGDHEAAQMYMERASVLGNSEGLIHFAEQVFKSGRQETAIEILQSLARSGSVQAGGKLLELAKDGPDVKNFIEWVVSHHDSFTDGETTNLGVACMMAGNSSGAVALWESAASRGNPHATTNLCMAYVDAGAFERAVFWIDVAAQIGETDFAAQMRREIKRARRGGRFFRRGK